MKIKELKLDEKHQMLSMQRITKSYWKRLLVELEDFIVLFPARSAHITDEECEKFNAGEDNYVLVYKGEKLEQQ